MKQRFLTVVLTLALLGAGFGTGIWTERHRPLPPPPIAFMGEMGKGGPVAAGAPAAGQVDRAELVAEITRIRPQIDHFRQQLDGIESGFEHDLQGLLTPAQRTAYATLKTRPGAAHEGPVMGPVSKVTGTARPLSAEQIAQLQQRPVFHVVDMVVVSMRLDWLVQELNLDVAQRARVQALLQERRGKFLALTDSAPLPSLLLSRLAPVAERLAASSE